MGESAREARERGRLRHERWTIQGSDTHYRVRNGGQRVIAGLNGRALFLEMRFSRVFESSTLAMITRELWQYLPMRSRKLSMVWAKSAFVGLYVGL